MTQRPLRFIHAGDMALHEPVGGLAEVPDQLVELFWQAPYRAAEQLVDAALGESVDFVLLCGEQVLAERSGPRGPLALCELFDRLRQHGIAVYWTGAPAWPAAFSLPENVYLFPTHRVAEVYHHRDKQPIARIVGCGRPALEGGGGLMLGPSPLFTIAVLPTMPCSSVAHGAVDYWACGGAETAGLSVQGQAAAANGALGPQGTLIAAGTGSSSPAPTASNVFCAGPLQGRSPQAVDPHGCWLVSVDGSGRKPATRFVPCDALRWQQLRVVVEKPLAQDELLRLVQHRAEEAQAASGRPLLYSVVLGGGGLPRALRSESSRAEFAAALRRGPQSAGVPWCADVHVEPDTGALAKASEEETLLGEYLRAACGLLEQARLDAAGVLDVATDLPQEAQALAGLVTLGDRACCERVLREAALLGLSVLTAEEPLA